ncbi:MAG: hypothetical protein GTO24_20075 [candidate division Zixibacteria bacterium]|nr:hypothetical protein [candidate division Zixibacteria bacterium]
MKEVEGLFFRQFSDIDIGEVPLVFILGSPRTGTTLVYQVFINLFGFLYFSNLVNDHFAEFPVAGVALSLHLEPKSPVSYESEYGKTQGYFGPSEGSFLFRKWFGGEHPSQTRSCEVLADQREHLVSTMKSIYGLTGKPILTKNAWNCFRIKNLVRLFPKIHFIWVRRDIRLSAFSDLKARYAKGSPTTWNSATTSNYLEIQKRPYWEQVVEQQYEYNRSIANDLDQFCPDQYLEMWYEDLCDDPEGQRERIKQFFISRSVGIRTREPSMPRLTQSSRHDTAAEDYLRICAYVDRTPDRLRSHTHTDRDSEEKAV